MPRVADLGSALQVSQVMVTAFSEDPANPNSLSVPVTSDTVGSVAIRSIATAQAKEMVVMVQPTVNMDVDINLISIQGIDDFTLSTTFCPAGVPTRIVATGLTTAAQIVAFLAAAAPPVGSVVVVAYARA